MEGVSIARKAKPGGKTAKAGKKTAPKGSGGGTLLIVLGGFAALVLVAGILLNYLNSPASMRDAGGSGPGLLPAGREAPGFSAETAAGEEVSLADKGEQRATMLVFFATWCTGCEEDAPAVADLAREREGLRVILVGTDGRDDPEAVGRFAEEHGIDAPAVHQPALGGAYRVSEYPTTYVLDDDEEVVFAGSGRVPKDVLEGHIEEALG